MSGSICTEVPAINFCNSSGTPVAPDPASAGNIQELTVGDTFTAANYKITVTELSNTSGGLFTGKGIATLTTLPLKLNLELNVSFENAEINDCYQLTKATKFITDYDPGWEQQEGIQKGFISYTEEFLQLQQQLIDAVDADDETNKINEIILSLNDLNNRIQADTKLDTETKTTLSDQITELTGYATCSIGSNLSPEQKKDARAGICSLNPWVALAKCLGAAAVDVFMQYTAKWIELIVDKKPKNFFDFNGISSAMAWDETLASATISCAFAIIPIPDNKVSAAIVAGQGIGAATTAFATNIIQQYNVLKDTYSLGQITQKINWNTAIGKAAAAGITQTILALISTKLSNSPKVQNFAKTIKDKAISSGPIAVRTLLKTAGLTDDAIDVLFRKFGIVGGKVVAKINILLPTTLESMTSSGGLSKAFFQKANTTFSIDPSDIAKIATKAASGAFADEAETAVLNRFLNSGFKKLEGKVGSNNGIDILLVDNVDNIKRLVVIEVKSSVNDVPYGVSLGSGYNSYQLEDNWITGVFNRLLGGNTEQQKAGAALRDHFGIIEKYLVEVDKKGLAKIIRVN